MIKQYKAVQFFNYAKIVKALKSDIHKGFNHYFILSLLLDYIYVLLYLLLFKHQIFINMKKTLLLTVALFVTVFTFAGNADLFDVNEQELNNDFAELTALENYVSQSNFITLSDIQAGKTYDLMGINTDGMGTSSEGQFAFQWEGFLWGFLCCPIGFFVIAVNKNKDSDQKLSYWIGVGASVVFSAITSPIYYTY
ncbi:MAG: hypothetical protein JXB34_11085 [Bacteroidales bacterium]|nr:hypothetical protein [Bacteroidales bacterium]